MSLSPCIDKQNTMVTILKRGDHVQVAVENGFEFMGNCKILSASMPPNRPCLSVWCGATCCPRPEKTMSFRTGEYCGARQWCKTVVQGEVYASRLGPKAFANVFQIGYYLTSFPLNAFTRHIAVHMPPGL